MLPKAVVIGCGGGGSSIRALDNIFEFTDVTNHDWTHPGGQTSWRKDNKAQQEQLPPLSAPSSYPKPTSSCWKVCRTSSSRQLGQTTSHHSCQPQATAGKLSRCQPNRSESSQPRGKHSSLVPDRTHPSAEERLTRWRARPTYMRAQPVSQLGSNTTSSQPHLSRAPLPPLSSTPPRAG